MTPRQLERFIGETARPWVLILSALCATAATVIVVCTAEDLSGAAILVAAIWAPVVALYGAKAAEETRKTAHNAAAEVAKVEAGK